MPNSLFNRFGPANYRPQRTNNNISAQLAQLRKNPGAILDILLQNGKISQQQYNDMQQYKNNPEMIYMYLINNGNANEIKQAEQIAGQIKNGNQ